MVKTVVLLPVTTIFPEAPKAILRTAELLELNVAALSVTLEMSRVPDDNMILPPNVAFEVNLIPSWAIESTETDQVPPPVTVKLVVPAMVTNTSTVVMFKVVMVIAVSTVAVKPDPASELASNIATSAAPGTDAPPPPPEVVDHLAVFDQLPVPPTQNLFAMFDLRNLSFYLKIGPRHPGCLEANEGVFKVVHLATQPVLPVPDSLTYKQVEAPPSVR